MLPITRANLHSFCRTCLKEFEEPPGKQKAAYDISGTENLSKWLRTTAGEVSAFDGYPKCLCHSCYMKLRTFYEFYEKSSCSVEALKELLTEITQDSMRNNLQLFCRTCLKRLNSSAENTNVHEDKNVAEWMLSCTGQDVNSNNHSEFPKKICNWCFKKLRNFVEFQGVTKQSLEYLENVVGRVAPPEEYLKIGKISPLHITEELKPPNDNKPNKSVLVPEKYKVDKETSNDLKEKHLVVQDKRNLDYDAQDESAIENFESDSKSADHIFVEKLPELKKTFSDTDDSFDLDAQSDSTTDYSDDDFKQKNNKQIKTSYSQLGSKNKVFRKTKRSNTETHPKVAPKKRVTADMVKLRTDQNSADAAEISEENESDSNSKKGTNSPDLSYGKKITCNQCGKKFYKKFLYIAHVKGVHEGLEKPFQCTICQNSFRLYHYLTRHIKEMHVSEAIAASRRLAGEHTEAQTENFEEGHKCLFCCKIFKRKEHLKEHHEAVHLQIRPYSCRYCDKSFSAGKTRRVHEMGHTGEKPFVCDKCNRGFRQRADLKVHMNQHSENKELLCPICNRIKPTREELDAHIAMHEASQQHQCSKCGRIFKKKCHLTDHDRSVHLKLRPFKCSFCELNFALLKTCRSHEKLHLDERPEVCTTCGKAFKQRNQLLKHIKRLHKKESLTVEKTN